MTGALGVARTLFYQGHVGTALYAVDGDGTVLDGAADSTPSFFHEYHFKLKRVYDGFHTRRGAEIAARRRLAMDDYYEQLLREVTENRTSGNSLLKDILK